MYQFQLVLWHRVNVRACVCVVVRGETLLYGREDEDSFNMKLPSPHQVLS